MKQNKKINKTTLSDPAYVLKRTKENVHMQKEKCIKNRNM